MNSLLTIVFIITGVFLCVAVPPIGAIIITIGMVSFLKDVISDSRRTKAATAKRLADRIAKDRRQRIAAWSKFG